MGWLNVLEARAANGALGSIGDRRGRARSSFLRLFHMFVPFFLVSVNPISDSDINQLNIEHGKFEQR